MAAEQKNFSLFTYVDDTTQAWNKRGELDAIRNAVDGSSAFGAHPNWGKETARHRTRKAVYQDPTTFRTKTCIIYTLAAFSALTVGSDTLAFKVEGNAGAVTYTLAALIGETPHTAFTPRNLNDHA
jgi:hypothetical protein